MPTAKLTRIDGVNDVLVNAGFLPVQSLSGSGPPEAVVADAELERQLRKVLARGYWFNLEVRTLTADASGIITAPPDIIRFDETTRGTRDYFERAGKLWQRSTGGGVTDVFEANASVAVCIVALLDFEDMPFEAQNYVVAKTRTVFQSSRVGDQITHRQNQIEEVAALAELEQANADIQDANVFANPDLRYVVRPPRPHGTL